MKIKVGIIGAGYMGSAHARVYSEIKEVDLIGICDSNPERKILPEKYGCQFFSDPEGMLKKDLDLVSICTPTSTHREIALKALEEGKHVFIEKPIALNHNDGKEIVKKAAKMSRLLGVGFLERFNSAIKSLKREIDLSQIYSTISLRFGPGTPRIKDIGVLLDLGSHEIDILNYLTKTRPSLIKTYISKNSRGEHEDYAFVSLKYGHIHTHIETSWLPKYKLRKFFLYGNDRFYVLDYMQQKVKFSRAPPKISIESEGWEDFLWASRLVEEEISSSPKEPLKLELEYFVKSIQKGEILDPICNGYEALEVLRIIEEALKGSVHR
jgi:UDP-N-acetylglucosamine 3-dehydrogenase